MNETKPPMPKWLRIYYIIIGIIVVGFGVTGMFNDFFLDSTIIIILGVGLFIISVTRVFTGVFNKKFSQGIRIFNMVIGLLILILSIFAIFLPGMNKDYIVVFYAVALLMTGVIAMIKGFEDQKKIKWYRFVIILFGAILISGSLASLIFDYLAVEFLLMLISALIILVGLRRILDGAFGNKIFIQPKVTTA